MEALNILGSVLECGNRARKSLLSEKWETGSALSGFLSGGLVIFIFQEIPFLYLSSYNFSKIVGYSEDKQFNSPDINIENVFCVFSFRG